MLEVQKYEKRGAKIKSIMNIRELMHNNLFSKALKECESFFLQFGEDGEILYHYAKCLSKMEQVPKAIETYLYLLEYQKSHQALDFVNACKCELFKLYYIYDYYKEAYALFDQVKEDLKQLYYYNISLLEKILQVKNGIEVTCDETSKGFINRLVNYNEDRALIHIYEHMHEVKQKPRHTLFQDIDLRELFYNVKSVLPQSKRIPRFHFNDLYLFYFPHIGEEDMETILVVTNKGTSEIVSIYPEKTEYTEFINYNLHELYLNKDSEKVKKISQIDKFYQRYGQK